MQVIELYGEEGLEREVHVDGIRLEHVSQFKYFGCVLDESGSDGAECSRKVASGGGGLQVPSGPWLMLEICSLIALVLHETLLVPVLMYGRETTLWRERERTRVRAAQIENLR